LRRAMTHNLRAILLPSKSSHRIQKRDSLPATPRKFDRMPRSFFHGCLMKATKTINHLSIFHCWEIGKVINYYYLDRNAYGRRGIAEHLQRCQPTPSLRSTSGLESNGRDLFVTFAPKCHHLILINHVDVNPIDIGIEP
jgi:hypothetical protein